MTEQQYNRLKPFKHIWILYKKTITANLESCAPVIREIAQQLTGLKYQDACSGCLPECLQKCFLAFDEYEKKFVTEEFNKSDVIVTVDPPVEYKTKKQIRFTNDKNIDL